jgi:hypothetical protein
MRTPGSQAPIAAVVIAGILAASGAPAEAFDTLQRQRIAACQAAILTEAHRLLGAQVAALTACGTGLALARTRSGSAREDALQAARKACRDTHVPAIMDASTTFVDNLEDACRPARWLVLHHPDDPLGFQQLLDPAPSEPSIAAPPIVENAQDLAAFLCGLHLTVALNTAFLQAPEGLIQMEIYLFNRLGIERPQDLIDPRCRPFYR